MALIVDIETVPASPEVLESRMPEELRNPRMPEAIADPEEPPFAEKCPKYASVKDEAQREAQRAAWIDAAREKFRAKINAAKVEWQAGCMEARAKFVRNAALDARLGHAKLIGLRDTETGRTAVFAWEREPRVAAALLKWADGVSGQVSFSLVREEARMIGDFLRAFREQMTNGREQCVTYYGNTFDFPFLYRRAWILGLPERPAYFRGRFFDESRMLDLDEIWRMGSRDERSGGLDALATALGCPPKTGDGETFWRWYQKDPVEGVAYLLNDLKTTEAAARKMGVIATPEDL